MELNLNRHLMNNLIAPVMSRLALADARLDGPLARMLVFGTMIVSARLAVTKNRTGHPRGPFGIRDDEYDRVYYGFLHDSRPDLRPCVEFYLVPRVDVYEQLESNKHLACCVCRLIYLSRIPVLPGVVSELAHAWKTAYELYDGAESDFVESVSGYQQLQ